MQMIARGHTRHARCHRACVALPRGPKTKKTVRASERTCATLRRNLLPGRMLVHCDCGGRCESLSAAGCEPAHEQASERTNRVGPRVQPGTDETWRGHVSQRMFVL